LDGRAEAATWSKQHQDPSSRSPRKITPANQKPGLLGTPALGSRFLRMAVLVAALFLCTLPGVAQVQVGENVKMNLSGDLDMGYQGTFGSVGSSTHGLGLGGDGFLSGSYFNPNFLSFSFQPYYHRAQDNSAYQSISDTSGFNASANIFGGSHFPGSISFGEAYNSTGQFGVPGTTGIVTHGDFQSFAIGWSALVPDWPTLSASYSVGAGSSSFFGTDSATSGTNRNFTLRSHYFLKGFRLDAGFIHASQDSSFPQFLTGGEVITSSGNSNAYQLSASHSMPMHGQFSSSFSRVDYQYDYMSGQAGGTSDSVSGNFTIQPTRKLSLGVSSNYSDSLSGSLVQEIIATGGAAQPLNNLLSTRSFGVNATAFYSILPNLSVQTQVGRQEQFLLGQTYGVTQFGASVNYSLRRPLFGALTFSLGVVDNATKDGNTGLRAIASVNFSRRIGHWETDANFIYSQNVQTLLLVYTTSSYNYAASISRKIGGNLRWTGAFSGGHSGFNTAAPGSGNISDRVSTSLYYRRYVVTGYWSTSSGQSLLTSHGLVPVPTGLPPSVLPPSELVLFNANAYGASLSATPTRRLVITGSYSRASGGTVTPLLASAADTKILNALLRYQFRKLYFTSGFTRFDQAIANGTPGSLPSVVNSYYFGISRWFKLF
jgi:hypothetical protein